MKTIRVTGVFLATVLLGLVACQDEDGVTPLGNWRQVSPLEGDARNAATSFVIGNKAYVGTGHNGEDRLKDFWEFDPGNGSWRQVADFGGTARNNAVAFSLNERGYVGTGYDNDYKKDFWEYDPAANRWTQKADFEGTARDRAVAFALQGGGYVGTGYTAGGKYVSDCWRFDPGSTANGYDANGGPLGDWVQVASYGGKQPKRRGAVGFVIDNTAYVGAGASNGVNQEDFWAYHPEANQWTQVASLSGQARVYAAAFALDGKGYVGGGSNNGNKADFWEYDPQADEWTQMTNFEGATRIYAVGFAIGERGYVGTGSNTGRFDDFWEFSPLDAYDKED
ncbi:MAG TPA: kelch repeat-containing protein [Cytophagales bacterium]